MPEKDHRSQIESPLFMKLSRLETLGDAIFAFSLTLLAFDLKLSESTSTDLAQNFLAFLPKLGIFIFTFLVVAQQWDVYQRTMRYIDHADGRYIWLNLFSLMFIVMLPASASILGNHPLQPLALIFFGANIALFSLISWIQWLYAAGKDHLIVDYIDPQAVKMVNRLWLYPPILIAVSFPLLFFSVYPVYAIWLLMPVLSYTFSIRTIHRIKDGAIKVIRKK